ncbi:GNAT family N-acetyltransferase [Stappia sp. GBMRC 2046]|uniref:L-ornithine N(alpha)-acyltransferase n=2 Tax=Stappia sediminis TaxID=2692190 RepID=A0A7X3LTD9_9HYPH|nr:GNAT family N-acetyltransferase [Stappia sediminis]
MPRSGLLSPRTLVRKFMPGAGPVPIGPGRSAPHRLKTFGRQVVPLGRIGSLEVRLARSAREIRKAQELRYHVFYEEMSALADAETQALRRDFDPFDAICDHLLVVDHDHLERVKPFARKKPQVVGTYRLLRQEVANLYDGFYTTGEYDLQPLIDAHSDLRFLELGRSCVLKPYRNKRTVELLWHGIWSYVLLNRIDVMIGCASMEGTDPDRLAPQLSFLHHFARAPEDWRVRAVDERYVEMNRIPKEAVDQRQALRDLPPLVKGYLRLGAHIGDGAVIDHQFGTTDVLIILPVSALNERYVNYYGADASRYAS